MRSITLKSARCFHNEEWLILLVCISCPVARAHDGMGNISATSPTDHGGDKIKIQPPFSPVKEGENNRKKSNILLYHNLITLLLPLLTLDITDFKQIFEGERAFNGLNQAILTWRP